MCNYPHSRDMGIAARPHKVFHVERPQFKPEQDRPQTKVRPQFKPEQDRPQTKVRGPRPQGRPRGPWVPNNMAVKSQIAELPALLLGDLSPEMKEEAVEKAAKHLRAVQNFVKEQSALLKRYSSAYEKMIEATMAASSTSEEYEPENPAYDEQDDQEQEQEHEQEDPVD